MIYTILFKVYVTDDFNVVHPGVMEVPTSAFGSVPKDPANLSVQFTQPGGRCGRYVIVTREIKKQYLTFWEISAAGYSLTQYS